MLTRGSCSLLVLILCVFAFQQKLSAKKININKLSQYTELSLSSGENESLKAYLLTEDLAKSLTAGTRTNLNFFIRNKNKRVFKYILSKADGTFVSEVNLKRKRFSLPSATYETSTNESLSLKIIDNQSRENIYSFSVQFNIDDAGDNSDVGSNKNVVDKLLFSRCFNSGKAENYSKCLELFFNNVSFSNEVGDVATVVNDSGNFLVNLPKASVNETAIENFFSGLADDSALLTKITGPVGAQGERGLQGRAGDSIWSIENTNKVTNNGSQGNQATQDLVFGDSTIEGNNQAKLAFEKSTGALRIGSTDNDQWLNRGDSSLVFGKNSNAIGNGSVSLGNSNINNAADSYILGDNNRVNNVDQSSLVLGSDNEVDSNNTNSIIQDTFVVGKSNVVRGPRAVAIGRFILSQHEQNNIESYESITLGSGISKDRPLKNDGFGMVLGIKSEEPAITISRPDANKSTDKAGGVWFGSDIGVSKSIYLQEQEFAPLGTTGRIYMDQTKALCVYMYPDWYKIAGPGTCGSKMRVRYSFVFPARDATNIVRNPVLEFYTANFGFEDGAGNMYVRKYSDDSIVDTIAIGSGNIVDPAAPATSSNSREVSLNVTLEANTKYYITIDEGFLVNASLNATSEPIDDKEIWVFTTGS